MVWGHKIFHNKIFTERFWKHWKTSPKIWVLISSIADMRSLSSHCARLGSQLCIVCVWQHTSIPRGDQGSDVQGYLWAQREFKSGTHKTPSQAKKKTRENILLAISQSKAMTHILTHFRKSKLSRPAPCLF